eukprot:403350967
MLQQVKELLLKIKGNMYCNKEKQYSMNGMMGKKFYNDDDEAMSYTTSRMRKPVSRIQSNMTVKRADAIKEKEAEMEQQVKQIPLQRNLVEDDSEIEIYRKMKQRDFDRKEEERKKQEAVRRKLNEVQKERKAYEDELMKKAFTFDTKGDIILVKHVNTEQLPKDAVNLELKYNLRKLPSSTKGVYSFEKPQKLAPMKKRESQSLQQIEELQNEEKDADKPKKKGKSANIIDFLATGKNLKLAFSGIKQVQNVIIPMGSNFDKMEPDTGVVIEEKGRTKKSQNSNSQVLGKLSRTDYSQRFSKTMFNFSVDSTSVNQNMMSMTQNSLLGADLYKQRVSQVQAMKVVEPNEQSLLKMNPVPRLNIDTSLDNNTLQLSQPLNDSLLYHTQSQSFNRDRINFKTSKTNPQSLLISPINDYKNFMIPKINQSSMQNQSMNMTSQSFLPNANQFTHSLTKTRSQLFLHKKNVPKLFDDTYGDQSLLLPPLKSKLDEVYDDIAKNNGQAPVGELNQNPSKNKKSRMPVTQIQSILKQAKSQKALAMSQTSVTFKFNETQDSSNQSQIKSMKYSQNQGGINVRSRPFIEKVTSSNKHHLPPPPLGQLIQESEAQYINEFEECDAFEQTYANIDSPGQKQARESLLLKKDHNQTKAQKLKTEDTRYLSTSLSWASGVSDHTVSTKITDLSVSYQHHDQRVSEFADQLIKQHEIKDEQFIMNFQNQDQCPLQITQNHQSQISQEESSSQFKKRKINLNQNTLDQTASNDYIDLSQIRAKVDPNNSNLQQSSAQNILKHNQIEKSRNKKRKFEEYLESNNQEIQRKVMQNIEENSDHDIAQKLGILKSTDFKFDPQKIQGLTEQKILRPIKELKFVREIEEVQLNQDVIDPEIK